MRCEQARAILIPADEPRIADADVARALAHAETCADCHVWIEHDRGVSRLIRESLPRYRAPQAVRERVYNVLAGERAARTAARARSLQRTRWVTASLVSLAAAVAALWVLQSEPVPEPGAIFVQDYLRKMVEREAIASSDREVVAAFLSRELGAPVLPPAVPGATLNGAEICLLDGQRGALLNYTMGGRKLSYYVVPNRGERVGPTPVAETVHLASEGAVRVVVWSDSKFAHAIVGDHSLDYLLTFAHAAGGY